MAKVEDLRSAPQEDFWPTVSRGGGPDGLMTYRYLGTRADAERGGKQGNLAIRSDMRNPGAGCSPLRCRLPLVTSRVSKRTRALSQGHALPSLARQAAAVAAALYDTRSAKSDEIDTGTLRGDPLTIVGL